jgi:hypothetical protein
MYDLLQLHAFVEYETVEIAEKAVSILLFHDLLGSAFLTSIAHWTN